jgi:hypothetical protein
MDLDPTPDSTPFFIDFKDAKRNIFFSTFFFLITCPKAHHLQSKKFYFLLKFCVKIFFVDIISVRSTHFLSKGNMPIPISSTVDDLT